MKQVNGESICGCSETCRGKGAQNIELSVFVGARTFWKEPLLNWWTDPYLQYLNQFPRNAEVQMLLKTLRKQKHFPPTKNLHSSYDYQHRVTGKGRASFCVHVSFPTKLSLDKQTEWPWVHIINDPPRPEKMFCGEDWA